MAPYIGRLLIGEGESFPNSSRPRSRGLFPVGLHDVTPNCVTVVIASRWIPWPFV